MGVSAAKQVAAANRVANENILHGGSDFYAEIGRKDTGTSPLWSGPFGTGAVVSSTAAGVFSVSKSIFAIYAAQAQTLASSDAPYFNMTSGRDTANGATCLQDNIAGHTVDYCLATNPGMGVGNGAHNGLFSYDSLHQQWWADKIAATSLAAKLKDDIAALYQTTFGLSAANIAMSSATISGGVIARPTSLRAIAQGLMNGTYNLKSYLNPSVWAPVNASLYFTDGSVVPGGSPAPSNQPWKYFWNHWVEPNGAGYWWAGSGGTVLWMDPTFTYYGLLFRVNDLSGGEVGTQSIFALQQIRRAFFAGTATQRGATSRWSPGHAFGPMRKRAW